MGPSFSRTIQAVTACVLIVATSSCAIFRDTNDLSDRADGGIEDDAGADMGPGEVDQGAVEDVGSNSDSGTLSDTGMPADAATGDMNLPPDAGGIDGGAPDMPGSQLPGCKSAPVPPQIIKTVGDGTPSSCDEEALKQELAGGGVVGFDCGGAVTITLTGPIEIASDTTLIGGNDVTIDGANATGLFFIDAPLESTSPHFQLFGMTLQNGYRFVTDNSDDCGAAISRSGGTLTAVDTTFASNGCEYVMNSAPYGGAIVAFGGGGVFLFDSELRENQASGGGALYTFNSEVGLYRSRVVDNEAIDFAGGGLALFEDGGVEICGSRLTGNRAELWGGGMIYDDDVAPQTTVTISQSEFAENSAGDDGGAADIEDTNLRVEYSTFFRNSTTNGGALWLSGVDLDVESSSFLNNEATEAGGAFYLQSSDGQVQSVSFVDNRAGLSSEGSAIANYQPAGPLGATNTVFARNNGSQVCAGPVDGGPNMQSPGQGDLCTDATVERIVSFGVPIFVEGIRVSVPDATSPAVGAGSACGPIDQLGALRPLDCTLGALEPR